MKPGIDIDLERLPQLPSSELVKIVVQQQRVIEQLKQEVARLKASLQKDSKTGSKPPSTDLLKKPEKPKSDAKDKSQPKRKPGGQPGQDLSVRLQAFLVWLGNYGHLSYEKQQELLKELGGVEIGVGTLVATNARMADAIKNSVEQLREWVKKQPAVHVDESPWPVLGLKEWLWVTTGQSFCVFHPGDTRSRAELVTQLGESFEGVLSTDDYSVYNGYSAQAQQKCLAHLLRHFKQVVKLNHGNNPALGEAFIELIEEAFAQHKKWRQTKDDSVYRTWAAGFKLRVELSIQQWIRQAGYEAGKLLRSLRDKAQQWWYFLLHPQIPPDNNLAERSLRLAVTKRKVSGGSRSMARFQQTADLLTVIQTCRRQGRSVLEFFQQALRAEVELVQSTCSLLPEPIP